jgi:hypothetical protein
MPAPHPQTDPWWRSLMRRMMKQGLSSSRQAFRRATTETFFPMRRFFKPVFIPEGRHGAMYGAASCSLGNFLASPDTVRERFRIRVFLRFKSAQIAIT